MAQLAHGATITFGTTVVAALRDISGPSLSRDTVDITAHDATDLWRNHIKGIKTGGEITFTVNYLADNMSHQVTNTGLVGDFDDSFNLITNNPGFEAGSLTGWTKYATPTTDEVTTAKAHDGKYSYHLVGDNGIGSGEGRYQNITLSVGETYTASCWVWPVSGAANIRFVMNDSVTGNTSDVATSTGAWERLSVSHMVGDAAVRCFLRTESNVGEAYYDSVMIQHTASLKDYVYALGTSTVTIDIPAPGGNISWSMPVAVTNFSPNLPVNGEVSADVTMMVMGKPTLA